MGWVEGTCEWARYECLNGTYIWACWILCAQQQTAYSKRSETTDLTSLRHDYAVRKVPNIRKFYRPKYGPVPNKFIHAECSKFDYLTAFVQTLSNCKILNSPKCFDRDIAIQQNRLTTCWFKRNVNGLQTNFGYWHQNTHLERACVRMSKRADFS